MPHSNNINHNQQNNNDKNSHLVIREQAMSASQICLNINDNNDSTSKTHLDCGSNLLNSSSRMPSCENLDSNQRGQEDLHLLGHNHHLLGHPHGPEPDAVSAVAGCGVSSMGPVSVAAIPIVGLKSRVGLFSGIALIVGTMIGSGIFLSPRGVLERTGSVGLSLVIWALSGLLSLLGALCYAELGTLISKSGAEYSYILEAFGGLLAFLFSWISVFILKPAMLSIICLTLSEYIVSPMFPGCPMSEPLVKLLTIFSIATGTQNLFTVAKMVAIVIVVIGGLVKLCQGEVKHISTGFDGSRATFSDIATAFYTSMWAYDGWNNLNYVTEELINPYRNLPLAIIYGIPIVTLCYVLVNISYLTVMSPAEILASDAVAVTWGNHVLGFASVIIPVAVVVSSFGAGNGSCFTSGRLSFAAARENHLPGLLAFIHIKKYTPSPALIFNGLLSILYVIPGNIDSLIDLFSFTAWLFYGLTMLALIKLRYKEPWKDRHRPYKVHLSIPILVFIISMYFVVAPIMQNPQIEYFYVMMYIVAGVGAYEMFVQRRARVGCLEPFTKFCQLILSVVPCDDDPFDEN
ncbi:b(0,+)-type amino acid transporter 1 [Fragariocoptes setiger]|uniref:B(0,+)-type amino acid transporter 1 n=1 Tax=Fragariocoptes setiger TaxID=1670756 RepID=A0ABQ7S7R2_9ACAR|nr:b(0,+)-type amino acid transporter 1 [Fragariocoptes setiger]